VAGMMSAGPVAGVRFGVGNRGGTSAVLTLPHHVTSCGPATGDRGTVAHTWRWTDLTAPPPRPRSHLDALGVKSLRRKDCRIGSASLRWLYPRDGPTLAATRWALPMRRRSFGHGGREIGLGLGLLARSGVWRVRPGGAALMADSGGPRRHRGAWRDMPRQPWIGSVRRRRERRALVSWQLAR